MFSETKYQSDRGELTVRSKILCARVGFLSSILKTSEDKVISTSIKLFTLESQLRQTVDNDINKYPICLAKSWRNLIKMYVRHRVQITLNQETFFWSGPPWVSSSFNHVDLSVPYGLLGISSSIILLSAAITPHHFQLNCYLACASCKLILDYMVHHSDWCLVSDFVENQIKYREVVEVMTTVWLSNTLDWSSEIIDRDVKGVLWMGSLASVTQIEFSHSRRRWPTVIAISLLQSGQVWVDKLMAGNWLWMCLLLEK